MTPQSGLNISVLGPFRAVLDGIELNLGPVRQQAVLLALVRSHNHVVSPARLLREVWGEDPPASGVRSIPPYIYRLRNILSGGNRGCADSVIEKRREGYLLRLDPQRLDFNRFEDVVRQARVSQDNSAHVAVRTLLGQALELWTGEPLAGLPGPVAQSARDNLTERWLSVFEQRIELDIILGHAREVVPELSDARTMYPLRERLTRLMMLALHQCDRQADALAAYQALRTRLVEQTGIEPSRTLRQTYEEILRAREPAFPPA